jgi:hypothetical protein
MNKNKIKIDADLYVHYGNLIRNFLNKFSSKKYSKNTENYVKFFIKAKTAYELRITFYTRTFLVYTLLFKTTLNLEFSFADLRLPFNLTFKNCKILKLKGFCLK